MLTYLHAIQIGVLLFFVFFLLSLIPYMIIVNMDVLTLGGLLSIFLLSFI